MTSPCLVVPLPDGSPAPSGEMLISQGAISVADVTWPSSGPCARHGAVRSRDSAATRGSLCIHMFHLAGLANVPSGNGVAVVKCLIAALGNQLFARRLDIALFVRRAALQRGRSPSDFL